MPDENGKLTYDELENELIGSQGMIIELQDHVTKHSNRAGQLAGQLRNKDVELVRLRDMLLKQGQEIAKLSKPKKGNQDAKVSPEPPPDKDHAIS